MTQRYQTALNAFIDESNQLIDQGLEHFVVLASHELYRYLYPVEPYCDFRHTDPVPWVENHIEVLVAFLKSAGKTFRGYLKTGDSKDGKSSRNRSDLAEATSDLYSGLWQGFSKESYIEEAKLLISRRMGEEFIEKSIVGKRCFDMGCGSGRYSVALAILGAREVIGVDFQAKAFAKTAELVKNASLPVTFREANVLDLPFEDGTFETVFSNGVLHHTSDWKQGVSEFARIMAPNGSGFLYLYARGGIFWETRNALRQVFARIPAHLTQAILDDTGMPGNRFIFMDTWYVPVEDHIARQDLELEFEAHQLSYEKVLSTNDFDVANEEVLRLPQYEAMWGEGEHRYLLQK